MQGIKQNYLFWTLSFLLGTMAITSAIAANKTVVAPANNKPAPAMTLINNPANVPENLNEIDYLKKYQALRQLPPGVTPIQVCSVEEKRKLMSLLDKNKMTISKNQKLVGVAEDGTLIDNSRKGVEVYKGDFSNQGYTEYLFMSMGNNGDAASVTAIYRLDNDKLIPIDFDNIVKTSLKLPDMSKFYLYAADPVAVIKDKKTYLRFMNLPEDFDKSKLLLCTYEWQGDKFALVGPDACIGGKADLAHNNANPNNKNAIVKK